MNFSLSIPDLNPQQKTAVEYFEGPLFVNAGAGSGKTLVITYRIYNLITRHHIPPHSILAITFTNKAAEEMKGRVEKLLGCSVNSLQISTFHSTCAKIIRESHTYFNVEPNFLIIDDVDKREIIKAILKAMELSGEYYKPFVISELISRLKNNGEEYVLKYIDETAIDTFKRIYQQYEKEKNRLGAFDFDDLLIEVVNKFTLNESLLQKYQERWKYILVDEFQDTNRIQYKFVKLLGSKYRNVCIVGDEDQTIYSWRGSTIENFMNFLKDFPEARVINLEKNYRSTKIILDAANAVIKNNKFRTPKQLWSDIPGNELIRVEQFLTPYEEAKYIADKIISLHEKGVPFSEIAIFYRTNYLSRPVEMILNERGIPYTIIGGLRFFERKEIKDILAYLRVLVNPLDEISLLRIINTPPRNIGKTSLKKIQQFAREHNIPLFIALERAFNFLNLNKKTKEGIKEFLGIINKLRENLDSSIKLPSLVHELLNLTNYEEYISKTFLKREYEIKLSNINELINHIREKVFENPEITLADYLAEVSLYTGIDEWERKDCVNLMTVHNAKGLEFDTVFIIRMEDGIFPHKKSMEEVNYSGEEEERRLFYVALTRAKQRVFITCSLSQGKFGSIMYSNPSPFIFEIPNSLIESFSFNIYDFAS